MIKIVKPDENNYLLLKYIFDQFKDETESPEFNIVANYFNCYFFFETDSESFIGCIYLYPRGDKIFVDAFATRGHHLLNLHILKCVLDSAGCDVYAEAFKKTSKLCVLRLGFKKVKDDIYIYKGVKNG